MVTEIYEKGIGRPRKGNFLPAITIRYFRADIASKRMNFHESRAVGKVWANIRRKKGVQRFSGFDVILSAIVLFREQQRLRERQSQ